MSQNALRMGVAFALIGALHSAWLFGAYGGGALAWLGRALHYNLVIFVWLGVSSGVAAFAYHRAACRIGDVPSRAARVALCVGGTLSSLYLGVYLAFNTYGT